MQAGVCVLGHRGLDSIALGDSGVSGTRGTAEGSALEGVAGEDVGVVRESASVGVVGGCGLLDGVARVLGDVLALCALGFRRQRKSTQRGPVDCALIEEWRQGEARCCRVSRRVRDEGSERGSVPSSILG